MHLQSFTIRLLCQCTTMSSVLYAVTCNVRRRKVWIRGVRGTLFKDFKHAIVTISKSGNKIIVEKRFDHKKRCAVVKTIAGHIQNMIVGVQKVCMFGQCVVQHGLCTDCLSTHGLSTDLLTVHSINSFIDNRGSVTR